MKKKSFLFRVSYMVYGDSGEGEAKWFVEYRLVYGTTWMEAEGLLRKQYGVEIVAVNMTIGA